MNLEMLRDARILLEGAQSRNDKTDQTFVAERAVLRMVIKAMLMMLMAMTGCSSTSFTMNDSIGGDTSWQPDSAVLASTTSNAAVGGSSSLLAESTGGQATLSNSLIGGASSDSRLSTGGTQAATGGTTADTDAGDCLCPDRPDCAPSGAACNASHTSLGHVTDKLTCVRLPSECPSADFNVYCFEC